MTSPKNRREVLRALLATSVGGVLRTSRLYGTSAELNAGGGERHDFSPVRQRILQEVASGKATGVAVAVVHKGRLVWEEGFGFSDREKSIQATARTPFCLASITKPFTTTLLMTLVAEGKVDLDASGNQYLAGNGIKGPNGDPHAARVRLLGAHVSGLPGMFSAYFEGGPTPAPDANTVLQEYGRLAYSPARGLRVQQHRLRRAGRDRIERDWHGLRHVNEATGPATARLKRQFLQLRHRTVVNEGHRI